MCIDGKKHSLIKIYSSGNEMEEDVVRWCYECGAIVVDVDSDGRTFPGRVMEMKRPNNFVKTEKTEVGVNR
jgi:predicted RNA-binding protein